MSLSCLPASDDIPVDAARVCAVVACLNLPDLVMWPEYGEESVTLCMGHWHAVSAEIERHTRGRYRPNVIPWVPYQRK